VAEPAAVSFGGVGYSSAALAWAGRGNPARTVNEYELSGSAAFAVLTSSSSGAVPGAVFTGLARGTTYYGRVRAVNSDGVPTAYVDAGAPAVTQVLRAGYNTASGDTGGLNGFALGFGISLPDMAFDYALRTMGELGPTHHLGVSFKWDTSSPEIVTPYTPYKAAPARPRAPR